MIEFLSKTIKSGAVLAAISAAIFYSLYSEILHVSILESLSQDQLFSFLIISLVIFGVLMLVGLILSSKKTPPPTSPKKHLESHNNSITVDNSGLCNSLNIFKKKK